MNTSVDQTAKLETMPSTGFCSTLPQNAFLIFRGKKKTKFLVLIVRWKQEEKKDSSRRSYFPSLKMREVPNLM